MTAPSGFRRAEGEVSGDAGPSPLERARRAGADLRWRDTYEALSDLDRRSVLGADDLELLATAAFLRGCGPEAQQARLRAYQIHVSNGDVHRAVRCATRIGLERLSSGEVAQAAGCLPVSMSACSALVGQASALLGQAEESAEHGYLLIPVAYEQLAMEGDFDAAASTAARAVRVGRRFGDPDLLALALAIQGRAMVESHRVQEGMASLDESVALVVAGGVAAPVAGLALTAALDAGVRAFELARCDEWTRALTRWCDGQEGMLAFRCRSLAHQAAFHHGHGRWEEALEVAERACERPVAQLDTTAAAAARYQQGEVLRLLGDLRAAEAAYRQASERGVDPQPGLALLRLAEGDTAAALAAIDRALGESRGGLGRARLLPARVEALLTAGDPSAAGETARELAAIAGQHGTPALEASAEQALASVLLAGGEALPALKASRRAYRVWRHFELPYEEARALLLIARCCARGRGHRGARARRGLPDPRAAEGEAGPRQRPVPARSDHEPTGARADQT